MRAYERAMRRAARFVDDHVLDAQRILADESGLELETVKSIWSHFRLGYVPAAQEQEQLVEDVIRRIKQNQPEKREREPQDVRSYFVGIAE
jgi:hypothetical protein